MLRISERWFSLGQAGEQAWLLVVNLLEVLKFRVLFFIALWLTELHSLSSLVLKYLSFELSLTQPVNALEAHLLKAHFLGLFPLSVIDLLDLLIVEVSG